MKKWTTVWGSSSGPAVRTECNYGKNITFRYAIPVLCDGEQIRITLSNLYSDEKCVINSLTVGKAEKVGERKTLDIKSLTFSGKTEGVIDKFSCLTSDPISYPVKKGDILNVSFYIKDITKMATSTILIGTYSYGFFCEGDYSKSEDFPLFTERVASRHFFLTQLDVLSENATGWNFFGDSITSYYWADDVKTLLMNETENKHNIAICRKTIAGARVLGEYKNWSTIQYGASGFNRFEREILEAYNCDKILVFIGINDIIHPNGTVYRPMSNLPTPEQMIDAYKFYIDIARKHNKQIYFSTIIPFKGWRSYNEERNEIRKGINAWIRSTDLIDGYIDFDEVIRDKDDFDKMPAHLTEDNLHPSKEGAMMMAQAFYDKFIK